MHGEDAEQVTVALLNANRILSRELPNADFGRARGDHAIDYFHGDTPVQSKYCETTLETLREVSEQLEQYPGYAGVFHIPKDQHLELVELHNTGTIGGYPARTIDSIRQLLEAFQHASGRNYLDGILPGQITYDEAVRLGELTNETRQGTLGQEQAYRQRNALADGEASIRRQSQDNKEEINSAHEHAASVPGFAVASSLAAIASGGIEITRVLIGKYRDGKNPFKGEFSADDWKEIGVTGARSAAAGGVLGGTVYQLTNLTGLAAPFAASLVSAVVGMKALHGSFRAGAINQRVFVGLAQFVVCEAAIVGLAVVAGQVVIPIPMLGTLVGGIAGRIAASILRDCLDDSGAAELASKVAAYGRPKGHRTGDSADDAIALLDRYFDDLDWLARLAFDPATNTAIRLRTSVDFGRQMNVPDALLLESTRELDRFMSE